MQPFLLLGDITGALAVLALAVLAFGGLLVFGGIRLQPTSATAAGRKVIGCVVMALGMVVVNIALAFLYDVWDSQPDRAAKREIEAMKVARRDTSWRAQARQSQQELKQFEQSFDQQRHSLPDSSQRPGVWQDSSARARDNKAPVELEW